MIKKVLTVVSLSSMIFFSCKKQGLVDPPEIPVKITNEILAPTGFNWENSRNLNINISISESKFAGRLYVVAIYSADPAAGGKLISKGSLTSITRFRSKIYLSNQINELYIVCMAPDKTMTTRKIEAGTADLDIVFGA